jgi:serine/threonine protein kinase
MDKKILDKLKQFGLDLEEYKISQSSGRTTVLIFDNCAVKIFPKNADIQTEIDFLSKIHNKYIIKILNYSEDPKMIVYEKLDKILVLDNKDYVMNIICDVSIGLFYLHSEGYTHGDVSIGNIGLKDNIAKLYDFESVKSNSTCEDMFKDVEMFLEDFIIQWNSYEDIKIMLRQLLERLRNKYTIKEKIQKKMPSGKIKELFTTEYFYEPEDFMKEIVVFLTN